MKYNFSILAALMLLASGSVFADLMIYPAKGQDAATQQKDEGECFIWARNQTGIDPMNQNTAVVAAPQQKQGGAMGGAVGGAAIGAIIGNSDDAKKGAGVGALVGLSRQRRANRSAAAQADQQNQQSSQISADNQATFNRAYGICLQGRGYTVG
ncbi:MAG: YMGG-like glycine zipper-containing protein [Motiliproteus sp.]